MKHATSAPGPMCRLVAGIAVGAACILTRPVVIHAESGNEPPIGVALDAAPDAAAPLSAGQWVHIDPKTGARVVPPAAVAVPAPHPAFSTSHEGLVEQPAPGGGVMVDLQGRFRSAATATVGADGHAAVDCVPPGTAQQE